MKTTLHYLTLLLTLAAAGCVDPETTPPPTTPHTQLQHIGGTNNPGAVPAPQGQEFTESEKVRIRAQMAKVREYEKMKEENP